MNNIIWTVETTKGDGWNSGQFFYGKVGAELYRQVQLEIKIDGQQFYKPEEVRIREWIAIVQPEGVE